jgi:hypothetical protein
MIHGRYVSHNFSRGKHDPISGGHDFSLIPSRPEQYPVVCSCLVHKYLYLFGRTSNVYKYLRQGRGLSSLDPSF